MPLLSNIYGHHSYVVRPAPQNYALVMTGEPENRILLNTLSGSTQIIGIDRKFTFFARLTIVDVGTDALFLLNRGEGTTPIVDISPNGSVVGYWYQNINTLCTVAVVPTSVVDAETYVVVFILYGYDKTNQFNYIVAVSQPFDVETEESFSVAVTYSGTGLRTGMKIYKDGLLSMGSPANLNKALNKKRMIVQTSMLSHAWMVPVRAGSMETTMEKIAIWTNVLSASAIKKLHKDETGMGNASLGDGLLGYFDMDDTGTGVEA